MRLSKNEAPPPLPYPLRSPAAGRESTFVDLTRFRPGSSPAIKSAGDDATRQAVADLMDLVANYRSDLLRSFLDVLSEADSTHEHAEELMGLVTVCGVAEEASPCATALAIAADLEKLAATAGRWTHPAQIVQRPNAAALHRLCEARIEDASGMARERLEKILPLLERTARLTEKAASRRVQVGASRGARRVAGR